MSSTSLSLADLYPETTTLTLETALGYLHEALEKEKHTHEQLSELQKQLDLVQTKLTTLNNELKSGYIESVQDELSYLLDELLPDLFAHVSK